MLSKFIRIVLLIVISLQITYSQDITKRENPQSATIIWDASGSMHTRNIAKEYQFLNNYFNLYKNLEIKLLIVNHDTLLEKAFTISNSNWSELKKTLDSISYDGSINKGTNIKTSSGSTDQVLLFSDGFSPSPTYQFENSVPVYPVVSVEEVNNEVLISIVEGTGGYIIDLTKAATDYIKYFTDEIKFDPLYGVNIVNKTKGGGTTTNTKGQFTIEAKDFDILEFSYVGYTTIQIMIQPGIKKLNLNMLPEDMELDEVVVSSKKIVESKTTPYGPTSERKIGYSYSELKAEDFNQNAISLADAIAGKVSGVKVIGYGNEAKIILRQEVSGIGDGLVEPLYVVDGVQYTEIPNFIDIQSIESVVILKSKAAAVRFGNLGRGGVILITTKTYKKNDVAKQFLESANQNVYTGGAILYDNLGNKRLGYINDLEKQPSIDDSYKMYLENFKLYNDSYQFFIDNYVYFKDNGNNDLALKILSNLDELFATNMQSNLAKLRVLEENNNQEDVLIFYNEYLRTFKYGFYPYFKLAQYYKSKNKHQNAAIIYERFIKNFDVDLLISHTGLVGKNHLI